MSEEKKNEVLDQEKELDANELDEVAGGDMCACFIGGGGKGRTQPGNDLDCACVAGGGGEWETGGCRCACVLAGGGTGSE